MRSSNMHAKNYVAELPQTRKVRDYARFNISGMIYETMESTLERFPSTLLGNEKRRKKYFEESRGTYFFDRHRETFGAILYYYQSGGILSRPSDIPISLFAKEVTFFDLGDDVLMDLKLKEGFILEDVVVYPKKEWQKKLWTFFEFPDSSIAAKLFESLSIIATILSVVLTCIETMPYFKDQRSNSTREQIDAWFVLEVFTVIWFTVEYIFRLISTPNKCQFFKSVTNFIDFLTIVPFFIAVAMDNVFGHTTAILVVKVVRFGRIFRILKLTRFSRSLQIVGNTMKASKDALVTLMLILILAMVLFSSIIFYAEEGENDMFTSIPDACWYCLVTMTTVGYGDQYPKKVFGKFVGTLCILCGILVIALITPIFASNFSYYYDRTKVEAKLPDTPDDSASKLMGSDYELIPLKRDHYEGEEKENIF